MKHLLEETNVFTYYTTISKNNIDFEVYNDDYGECFYLAWIDPITKEAKECGCGTFNNNFHAEIENIANSYRSVAK